MPRPTRAFLAALPTAALLLAGTLALSACSSTGAASSPPASGPASASTEQDDDASRLEALYWARQDSARAGYTEAEVRFMNGMIKHHAQALVMSRMAPARAASGRVETLAARIINSQQDEIASMQSWLGQRSLPVPQVEIDGTRLRVGGDTVHGMPMAGVLTEEQIQQLDQARGHTFDRLFLEYMIEHHSGAVAMVDRLFETDDAAREAAAFELASGIHADQVTEIARMRQVLASL